MFNTCGRLKHVGSLKFKNLRVFIYEIVLVETWHILPFLSVNLIDHALHYTDAYKLDDQNTKNLHEVLFFDKLVMRS